MAKEEQKNITKAAQGDWDKDFNTTDENSGGDEKTKINYIDMSKPGNYRVRLVGPHVKCRKHFKPYTATVQDGDKGIDPAWQAGWIPGKRNAINIIDKTGKKPGEVGELKVLEKGQTVFSGFANYKSVFGIDPAGKDGPDFNINVKVPMGSDGKPNKLKTEYSVTHIEKAPFTKEEIAMIKEKGLYPLPDIYRSTTAEKMQEMWDAIPEEKRKAPVFVKKDDKGKVQENSTKNVEPEPEEENEPITETITAPSTDDDLFGDQTAKDGEASTEMF
jgi:hypothetical protein